MVIMNAQGSVLCPYHHLSMLAQYFITHSTLWCKEATGKQCYLYLKSYLGFQVISWSHNEQGKRKKKKKLDLLHIFSCIFRLLAKYKLPNSISWNMCFYLGQWLGEGVGCIFRIRCPNTMITMSTVSTLPLGKSLKLSGKISGSQTTGSLRFLLASI